MTSGIGPVEESAHDSREARERDSGSRDREIIVSNSPSGHSRSRLRAPAMVAATTVALTAGLLTTPLGDAPRTAPAPWPLSVTQLTYTGLRKPPDPHTRTFAFRLQASLAAGPPTTLTRLTQPYDGLTMNVTPATPLTLKTGKPRNLTLVVAVHHCTGLPQGVELPLLNVTLRNMRGTQNPSYILGAAYAQDLSTSLHAICA
ncbi:Tat pathway signal sequence domain protein [Streptomyces sp. NPDC001401]|uniref:Tat pathway signal sequence domain protein n=1 Tax=Streptomyces sp. NPDC001401 TaxID=3364570 RepID=UPI0036990901